MTIIVLADVVMIVEMLSSCLIEWLTIPYHGVVRSFTYTSLSHDRDVYPQHYNILQRGLSAIAEL